MLMTREGCGRRLTSPARHRAGRCDLGTGVVVLSLSSICGTITVSSGI